MQTKKQNNWSIIKPILIICILMSGIIACIHLSTLKKIKEEKRCSGSNCKKVNADILDAISVKLM